MAQRKAFGKERGPTGRKRDEFQVFASGRDKKELDKPHAGRTGYAAYGQAGVHQAKQTYHRKFPHRWKKFGVYNESRIGRIAEKKRTVAGVKYTSEIIHHMVSGKHIYTAFIYRVEGRKKSRVSNTSFGTRHAAERDAELKIARHTHYLRGGQA